MPKTLDSHHCCSMHFELGACSFAVVVAITEHFLSTAVAFAAAAAADAYYSLVMAMVVTRIEYVAFEPVAVSTVCGERISSNVAQFE